MQFWKKKSGKQCDGYPAEEALLPRRSPFVVWMYLIMLSYPQSQIKVASSSFTHVLPIHSPQGEQRFFFHNIWSWLVNQQRNMIIQPPVSGSLFRTAWSTLCLHLHPLLGLLGFLHFVKNWSWDSVNHWFWASRWPHPVPQAKRKHHNLHWDGQVKDVMCEAIYMVSI